MSGTDRNSLKPQLDELAQRGLYRRRRVVQDWSAEGRGVVAVVDGAERVVFCSNDYLGLARHPHVVNAFKRAVDDYGVGSGAAHLITGHSAEHHALEDALAEFTGRERALLFSTGYMANLGVATALVSRGDAVFEDRFNHASLLDGGLLSGARFARYEHASAEVLAEKLGAGDEDSSRSALVMTDGVFSMDGDIAPLGALSDVCGKHSALLMVDDAHGIGVLGKRGRGSLEEFGLNAKQVPVLMGTLGKALGTFGAFVAGDEDLIEMLIQKARTYIYTTALPPAVAAATRASLELVDSEGWRRERVLEHVAQFRKGMQERGLAVMESRTPIQPVLLGTAKQAVAASEALWERGFWVSAIRPPTVPEGTARLRITLSAEHTEKQINRLVDALADVLRSPAVVDGVLQT